MPSAQTGWRVCIDARPLNALLPQDPHPIPVIREIFDRLHGFEAMSTLDLAEGYTQFLIAEADCDKVSFIWEGRRYRFCSAPYGLCFMTSRFQRLEESVLLRTLGATKKQVLRIMNVEFLLLGTLATLTGAALSILGSWGLAAFTFELSFAVAWVPLIVSASVIIVLTVLIGRLASRGLHDKPPLEVLRVET